MLGRQIELFSSLLICLGINCLIIMEVRSRTFFFFFKMRIHDFKSTQKLKLIKNSTCRIILLP